jgi:hypothetical protein
MKRDSFYFDIIENQQFEFWINEDILIINCSNPLNKSNLLDEELTESFTQEVVETK